MSLAQCIYKIVCAAGSLQGNASLRHHRDRAPPSVDKLCLAHAVTRARRHGAVPWRDRSWSVCLSARRYNCNTQHNSCINSC